MFYVLCTLHSISVKKGAEGGEGGEMGDSDSSDSDVIGPPLPPGYPKKAGTSSMEPSHSQVVTVEEGESDDEEDDVSVSFTTI